MHVDVGRLRADAGSVQYCGHVAFPLGNCGVEEPPYSLRLRPFAGKVVEGRRIGENMAQTTVSMAELRAMTAGQRKSVVADLLSRATAARNGQASALDDRIRDYELRFEMTSTELRERLRSGQQPETAEIAKWLFLLDARASAPTAAR